MNRIQYIRFVLIAVLVLLFFTPPLTASAKIADEERYVSKSTQFNPGWYVDFDFPWSGGIGDVNIFAVEVRLNVEFFAGVSLPLETNIIYPEWLNQNESFYTLIGITGLEGGRAGLAIGGGISVTFTAVGVDVLTLESQKGLDLSLRFRTPIGTTLSEPIRNEIEIGGLTLPIINWSIKAYLGVELSFVLTTVLSSQVRVTGDSLVEEYDDDRTWTYQGQQHNLSLKTKPDAATPVRLGMDNIEFELPQLALTVTSIYIDIRPDGLPNVKLPLPLYALPSISFPIIGTLDQDTGKFHLAESSENHYASLDIDNISIPIVVPFDWNFVVIGLIGTVIVIGFLLLMKKN